MNNVQSKPVVILFYGSSGLGKTETALQLARQTKRDIFQVNIDGQKFAPTEETLRNIAANDGLSYEEWREWFKDYSLSHPLAIIQFTQYRY